MTDMVYFVELFGYIPEVKVFVHLVSNTGYEYTVREVAECTGLPEDKVEKVIRIFKEYGMVEGRMIEGEKRYKMNINHPIVIAGKKCGMEVAKWAEDNWMGVLEGGE